MLANQAANCSALPSPSHSTVISEAAVTSGLVVSSIVNVAVVLDSFPQSSVAVNSTVAAPVAPHKSERASKLFDQVTLPQTSEAVAPPLFANQACKAAVLPSPSHSTVISEAGVISGLVVSSIVNVADVLDALPQSSEAVNTTKAEPVIPHKSDKLSKSLDQVTSEQPSEAKAPPLLANQASNCATLPAPSHSTVISSAALSIEGLVVSSIVKVAVVLDSLPQSSVAVNSTVAAPVAPHKSDKPSKLFDQTTSEQSSEAVAPPLLVNQACKAAVLPSPSHSTVISEAGVIVGSVTSCIVNVASVEELNPQASVTVNNTVAEPVAPHKSDKPSKLFDQVTSEHKS